MAHAIKLPDTISEALEASKGAVRRAIPSGAKKHFAAFKKMKESGEFSIELAPLKYEGVERLSKQK